MTWRHPTTILREEFSARGLLPAPPRGQRSPALWQVHLHSEKRDGRWYSWTETQASDNEAAVDAATDAIAQKYDIEVRRFRGTVVLAWPEGFLREEQR